MRVLLAEPPKSFWFVMGEYLPPPLGILELASYLERELPQVEIEVVDCQAMQLDWRGLERKIESFRPDVFASSGLATCNAYVAARAAESAKKVDPEILTVVGGQHFTALPRESLDAFPEIDVVVRGEGEATFAELVRSRLEGRPLSEVEGISFRYDGRYCATGARPLIEDLDSLPLPGYHFVKDLVHKYHFTMMAGPDVRYALVEGSRGCSHSCTFCSQWRHWQGRWRTKSARRIADEMESLHRDYDFRFLWLTDDNFTLDQHVSELCEELVRRGLSERIEWFVQARCDDVVAHSGVVPKMWRAGCRWMLLGAETSEPEILHAYGKSFRPDETYDAVKILKANGVFAQTTFIIGHRRDTRDSIERLRDFADRLDPDLAIFMILTPFPGTEVYQEAERNGWIEDRNWADYDMIHAIMPTETLSREQLQEELYRCYRSFYGSWRRRLQGIFSSNRLKSRTYRYLARQAVLRQLRG
jgi:anaerobic magnesium-protoporphyrin IX monomethyl ester cyclase